MLHFRTQWQNMSNCKKTCQLTEYIDIALSDLVYIIFILDKIDAPRMLVCNPVQRNELEQGRRGRLEGERRMEGSEGREEGGRGVFLNYRKTPTRGKSLASLAEENRSGRSKSLALAYCTCYH